MSPSGSENGDNLPRPGGHSRSSSDDAPPNVDDRSDRVASSGGAPPPPALADSPPKSPSKPPLPPGVSRRGHPLLRKGSLGDESVASAISAMSEEEMQQQQQQQLAENQKTVTHRNIQKPKGAHKRNVSWSHDAPPSTGSVALQQPDLTGEHGGGTGGGAMNGIGGGGGGGGGGGPTGPHPPALKPKLQVQRNKTMDSLISNLSPDPRGPGHVRTNTRITLTDLTVSQCDHVLYSSLLILFSMYCLTLHGFYMYLLTCSPIHWRTRLRMPSSELLRPGSGSRTTL